MTTEPTPALRRVILEPVYLRRADLVAAEAQPILDHTGNPIRDDDGGIIYS